jgi:hypothetical protein
MRKTIISILFMFLYANGIQADKLKQADSMSDHVKTDLALLQSFEIYSQAQSVQPLAGSFLTVGADLNWCDRSSLQAAINDAAQQGITEIRVAYNKTYHENLIIDDISISLIGGYSSCLSALSPFTSPNSTQAEINGGGNGSVIVIRGSSQKNTILLKNLELFNGVGTKFSEQSTARYGGGIYARDVNAKVSLNNVDVRDNTALAGGGISIYNGDTDMVLLNSRVAFNSASSAGGGISCNGAASSIVLAQNSGIYFNEARRGGGVYVSECYFGQYSGSATGGLAGISSNRASGAGGGIYAFEATVSLNGQKSCPASGPCLGDNIYPASIRNNIAGLSADPDFADSIYAGGGIFAFRSTVTINAGYIAYNSALSGGGIFLEGSDLTVKRSGKACWDNQRCNIFFGNVSEKDGGAIFQTGGNVDISASFFEQNFADRGAAIISLALGEYPYSWGPGFTRVEGSVFNHNGTSTSETIFHIEGESGLEIVHSTIADNTISSIKPRAAILLSIFGAGDAPALGIHSSILDNPGFENLKHNILVYTASFSCIITNDVVSLSAENDINNPIEDVAGGAKIFNTIAGFADRNNRDYRLVAGSAAIDLCHTPTFADVNFKDIEFQERGVDDPNRIDLYFHSFYDIGADEAYVGPMIFKDGFE